MFESFRLWLSNRAFDLYMWLCPEVHNPFASQDYPDLKDLLDDDEVLFTYNEDDDKIEW